jgi:nitrile hydratase
MSELSQQALRAEALESLLVEKGLLSEAEIDQTIELYNERVGPINGAKMVVRAWLDDDFRKRLLADGTAAVAEFNFVGGEVQKLVVVENTPDVHNMVVCTLCSCYPWSLLGLPPSWYKSFAYRSRVVSEPRAVLREFGVEIPQHVEVRVWDSTAEVRYLVIPQRPQNSDSLGAEALASMITRNGMIGTALL